MGVSGIGELTLRALFSLCEPEPAVRSEQCGRNGLIAEFIARLLCPDVCVCGGGCGYLPRPMTRKGTCQGMGKLRGGGCLALERGLPR